MGSKIKITDTSGNRILKKPKLNEVEISSDGSSFFSDSQTVDTLLNGKNLFNSNGTIKENRTIETSGSSLTFNDTNNNISYGLQNVPVFGNRAFTAIHVDSGFTFMIANKAEDAIGNSDQNVLAAMNNTTGEIALMGTIRVGAYNNALFNTMHWIGTGATENYELTVSSGGVIFSSAIGDPSTPKFWIHPNGSISAPGLLSYANNEAAIASGLTVGVDLYVNSTSGAVCRVI